MTRCYFTCYLLWCFGSETFLYGSGSADRFCTMFLRIRILFFSSVTFKMPTNGNDDISSEEHFENSKTMFTRTVHVCPNILNLSCDQVLLIDGYSTTSSRNISFSDRCTTLRSILLQGVGRSCWSCQVGATHGFLSGHTPDLNLWRPRKIFVCKSP